ncbi:MAG: NAD(P)/FAD-dependent oxidoreductase [Gammaproteobacteria bacterium]|jgi:geranylgeranyl reductase family protein
MDTCDVLIVGGGPAGSSCARRLVAAGLDVIVLDKSQFPRDKVCAGWVTPAVVQELDIDLDDYRRQRICQPIQALRTGAMQGPYLHNQYEWPVSYGIRRFEFDDYLLKRSGARLRLGESFRQIRRTNGQWVVNDSIAAPIVVGAGGHFCPVARHMGAHIGKSELPISAQEVEFEMTPEQAGHCKVAPDTPELFFYPDLSGYGWIFRKDNYLNVGVGRETGKKIANSAQEFIAYCQQLGRLPEHIPAKLKGHAYLLYDQSSRKIVDDGILLIGDAAGLAYTESGEGIRPAVESGLMAADVISRAKTHYTANSLQPYQAHLSSRFGKKQNNGWLPGSLKQALAKHLLANRFLSRHILIERFFLHRHQPPMVLENQV